MMSESTAQRPLANLLEYRLDSMRELGKGLQPDHRPCALEAMGRAERLVEMRTVPLTPLQIHQPFFQADEKLARPSKNISRNRSSELPKTFNPPRQYSKILCSRQSMVPSAPGPGRTTHRIDSRN